MLDDKKPGSLEKLVAWITDEDPLMLLFVGGLLVFLPTLVCCGSTVSELIKAFAGK